MFMQSKLLSVRVTVLVFLMTSAGSVNAAWTGYTDRAAWEAAAASAGLTVSTNDFSTDPSSGFNLGGGTFSQTGGTYANERKEGGVIRVGYEGGGMVYGMGFDFGRGINALGDPVAGTALIRARETGGLLAFQSASDPAITFIGVISDQPYVATCGTVFTCPGFGSDEAYISFALAGTSFVDNWSVASTSVADADGDGVADSADNCQLIANAAQLDTNGDGYGNACDPDLDNNGVVNFLDASLFGGLFGAGTGDGDFNGDGNTNFLDYSIFPDFFGGPPGPSGVAP